MDMNKELTKHEKSADVILQRTGDIIAELKGHFSPGSLLSAIGTKTYDGNSVFKMATFTPDKLQGILEKMPEQNRIQQAYGRTHSIIDNRLMTATLEAGTSPETVIKQCGAQIESRRAALKANVEKLNKSAMWLERKQEELPLLEEKLEILNLQIDEKQQEIEHILELKETPLEQKLELADLKIQSNKLKHDIGRLKHKMVERLTGIADSKAYVEGCVKEIASFSKMYEEVCKTHGWKIGEWDESDMHRAQLKSHMNVAFIHSKHDVQCSGTLGNGTLFWIEGLGISPASVLVEVKKHIAREQKVAEAIVNPLKTVNQYKPEFVKQIEPFKFINGYHLENLQTEARVEVGFNLKNGIPIAGTMVNNLYFDAKEKPDAENTIDNYYLDVEHLNDAGEITVTQVNRADIDDTTFGVKLYALTIEIQEMWLDEMYEKYKACWKATAKRLGISKLVDEEDLYRVENKVTSNIPEIDWRV
ncbi:MAG: hypothetical protein GY804_09330 [Alphaproteobacteria bacterium]|nr:hypothetical protein [Alphaproteobacteria bacterium]